MKTPANPFGITTYLDPEYFCDRISETKTLIKNIQNNANTSFFALRRLGKTALIKHTFHQIKQQSDTNCIYIDAYPCQNLLDFTNLFANAIYQIYPEKRGIGKKLWEALKLLRPIISVDPISGNPELSLDISKTAQLEKSIPQLFQFLDNQPKKTVIAVDEFQQILTFPEKNVEAILRSAIQNLKNTNFILCGSNQAMMHQIFNYAATPFYASCKSIHLQKIKTSEYRKFIENTFQKFKFSIPLELVDDILEFTHGHTYYTQYFCHKLFAYNQKKIDTSTVQTIKHTILKDKEGECYQYRNLLTATQWQLLKAFAKEEYVYQPYGKTFIARHNLGSPAIVKRTLEALLQKEMIYWNNSSEKAYYAVYDKFLMRWLQNM